MAAAMLIAVGGVLVSAGARRASAGRQTVSQTVSHAALAFLSGQIAEYQRATWHWQGVMGVPQTHTAGRVLAEMNVPDLRQAVRLWLHRAHAAQLRAQNPPHLRQWLCIHHYEGSWTDSGAPYYGGLQMNLGFQRTYGPWLYLHKGTADHWTPLEQIWTAENAFKSRGFWPWPNTARFCGLI
jgi:hypothetical protein